ncbi:MAG: hypothetical protein ABI359_07070 [Ginsengibacter sp.]
MKTNRLHNRNEKIKFLNDLKKGISKINDITYPECEIWKKDSTGYIAVPFSEHSRKNQVTVSINKMENKMKAKNKTVIKTHNDETFIVF